MGFEVGEILKLSTEGLNWIAGLDELYAAKLALQRYEYRRVSRRNHDCLSVKAIPKGYYRTFHKTFLERAN